MSAGLVGFVCPNHGQNVEFEQCIGRCQDRCMSLPLLMALMGGDRKVEDGVYHVTEILNPPQVVYYSRKYPHYTHPHSLLWAEYGSAFHTLIEKQHDVIRLLEEEDFAVEHHFEVDLGIAILSGTADLYDRKAKTLWDYKTIKTYAVMKLKAGNFKDNKYADQLNIYRAYAFPEAEHLIIEAIVKDWSSAVQQKDHVQPIEDIEVPLYAMAETIQMVNRLVAEHVDAERSGEPRPCTEEEMWINKNPRSQNCGVPLRCRDYCPAVSNCKQGQEALA